MLTVTAPFNNMRSLKFKAKPTQGVFRYRQSTVRRLLQASTMLSELCSTICFDYRAHGSNWKLGGTAEHLIGGTEKRICRLSFEF